MKNANTPQRPGIMERLKFYKKPKPGKPGKPSTNKPEQVHEPLKLYKKPKPGQHEPEPADIKEPLNFLAQLEQEALQASHTPHQTIPPETTSRKGAYLTLVVLLASLCGALFYFYYKPAPPEVTGSQDRTSLLPICQQGSGIACGELGLLEYHGLNSLEGIPKEIAPNVDKAFIYARLACSRDSAFGCYMMWRLWTKKETNLLSPASVEEALRTGCGLGNDICCLLKERAAGKRDITLDELNKTITDATGTAKPPRYAKNDREQRLFTYFIVIEQ